MIAVLATLYKEIEDAKKECLDKLKKLVLEDAPKNKYTVLTGELMAYEEIQNRIDNLERQRENSEGNGQIRVTG